MKFWEAVKALQEGKKVRGVQWTVGLYINTISYSDGDSVDFLSLREALGIEWELYEEAVKTYSFAEIVPFIKARKRVKRLSSKQTVYFEDSVGKILVYPFGHAWVCKIEDFEATDWIIVE